MQLVHIAIAKAISKLGYTLVRATPKLSSYYSLFSSYYSRGDVYFEVDTSILCHFNQFFFHRHHWHYHTRTVEAFIANPNLHYQGSILEKYYQTYQPLTCYDLYFTLKPPLKYD